MKLFEMIKLPPIEQRMKETWKEIEKKKLTQVALNQRLIESSHSLSNILLISCFASSLYLFTWYLSFYELSSCFTMGTCNIDNGLVWFPMYNTYSNMRCGTYPKKNQYMSFISSQRFKGYPSCFYI